MTHLASSHPHLERSSLGVDNPGSALAGSPEPPASSQPPFWPPPPGWKPTPGQTDNVGPAASAWRLPEEHPSPREWAGLGAAAAVGFFIAWGAYEFLIAVGPEIDCASLLLTNAHPVGGETAGHTIAPLLGLGLLTAGGFASWRWRTGRRIALLVGLGALYIASLVIIWYALPPGPSHCVWTP